MHDLTVFAFSGEHYNIPGSVAPDALRRDETLS
jgi:hypothetical protein